MCIENEALSSFFIVLEGTVVVEESRVHHAERQQPPLRPDRARFATVGKGSAFGHLPIILYAPNYGYTATSGDVANRRSSNRRATDCLPTPSMPRRSNRAI